MSRRTVLRHGPRFLAAFASVAVMVATLAASPPQPWPKKTVYIQNHTSQTVWVTVTGYEVNTKTVSVSPTPHGQSTAITVGAVANTCVVDVRMTNVMSAPKRGAKPSFGKTVAVTPSTGNPPIKVATLP